MSNNNEQTESLKASASSPSGKYAATQGSRLMRRPKANLKNEDDLLKQPDRDRLLSLNLDQQRNFAVASWGVRKHLDFVAEHNFDGRSESDGLNQDVEGIVTEWSRPANFDIRARHGMADYIRMAEAARTIGGDMLVQKVDTCKVQAIEADRVRDPEKKKSDQWRNGIFQNAAGRALWYCIHKRTKKGFKQERILPASDVFHFGYFTRFDQARGVTPISNALMLLAQLGKGIDYALGRSLISQIFGFVHKTETPNGEEVDLTNGPFFAEIGMDESIESLSDKTPSSEFQSFVQVLIGIILKCLDLPYNFWDESHTNFFGSRAALIIYIRACLAKRRQVQQLLVDLTRWKLNYEVGQGRFRLPRSMTVEQIPFAWVPVGMPWWNPTQEATAAEKKLNLKITTRAEIYLEATGKNWKDSVPHQLAAEEKLLRQIGLIP